MHGATSRRWCGATRHASVAHWDTARRRLTTQVASTAVSEYLAETGKEILTRTDYSFFGNNVAAGQFEAQVWAPVCHDPDAAAVAARDDAHFDWTR